jgi:hypothetical protein
MTAIEAPQDRERMKDEGRGAHCRATSGDLKWEEAFLRIIEPVAPNVFRDCHDQWAHVLHRTMNYLGNTELRAPHENQPSAASRSRFAILQISFM